MTNTEYSTDFYDDIRAGARSSAAAVVPVVLELTSAQTVVDVGCGEGWWGREFAERGCSVLGIDGGEVQHNAQIEIVHADLEARISVGGRFDLAVCLEVAEHLSADRAAGLVADLVGLAPSVLFSAAVPGQPGTGHINCQPPSYWSDLFAMHGYGGSGALRSHFWGSDDVEWWYQQNLLIFSDHRVEGALEDGCPYLVHPTLYDYARGQR